MSQDQIKINEFEFYYLVELTRQKIKPLSRWEKPLSETTHRWLRRQGFYVDIIPRLVNLHVMWIYTTINFLILLCVKTH
jgi:hypothetical protein